MNTKVKNQFFLDRSIVVSKTKIARGFFFASLFLFYACGGANFDSQLDTNPNSESSVLTESPIAVIRSSPDIRVDAVSQTEREIHWSSVKDATSYRVYLSPKSDQPSEDTTIDNVVDTSYKPTLTDGQALFVAVSALWGTEEGPKSPVLLVAREPVASFTDVLVDENSNTVTVTVNANLVTGSATLDYRTYDNTSIDGNDYQSASGTLTFTNDVRSQTISVSLIDDSIYEGDETFTIGFSNASGLILPREELVVTIRDNETRSVVETENVSISESKAVVDVAVKLSQASAYPITVNYVTKAATAKSPEDFRAANGAIEFLPGEVSKSVAIAIADDPVYEMNETFAVEFTMNDGISSTTAQSVVTILDNESIPSVSISSVVVDEVASSATLNIRLSHASVLPVSVGYASQNISAVAPDDYVATNGAITFAPGITSASVVVAIVDDTLYEVSERFKIRLNSVNGGVISNGVGEVTIRDNDPMPLLTIDSISVSESATAATSVVTVSLRPASGAPVTVNFATTDGSAIPLVDYNPTSGILTFNPGETTKQIPITIIDDTLVETAETIIVYLSNLVGANFVMNVPAGALGTTGIVTIIDNDVAPVP